MGYPIQQSQTAQPLLFLMVDSTDHLTGKTGLSPTVTLSKNGAAFASPAGAVTEIGVGWYKVAGNATDAATLGPLALHATGTGADPTDDRFDVVAYNPQDSAGFGLSRLDAAVTTRASQTSLDVVDDFLDTEIAAIKAKTDNLPPDPADASDLATAIAAVTSAVLAKLPAALVGGRMDSNASAIGGDATAATNLRQSALSIYVGSVTGAVSTTTLVDSGLTQANDHWIGRVVLFTTGTLAKQATVITDFVAATDTLTFTALTAAPSGGDAFVIV